MKHIIFGLYLASPDVHYSTFYHVEHDGWAYKRCFGNFFVKVRKYESHN